MQRIGEQDVALRGGLLFKAYRERAGMKENEVPRFGKPTIQKWERGEGRINDLIYPWAQDIFLLNDEQTVDFILQTEASNKAIERRDRLPFRHVEVLTMIPKGTPLYLKLEQKLGSNRSGQAFGNR